MRLSTSASAPPSLIAQALAPDGSAWVLQYDAVTGAYGAFLILAVLNVMLCVVLWTSHRSGRAGKEP